MYIGFKTTFLNRRVDIKNIIVIFPDNSFKNYDVTKISKKIKANK